MPCVSRAVRLNRWRVLSCAGRQILKTLDVWTNPSSVNFPSEERRPWLSNRANLSKSTYASKCNATDCLLLLDLVWVRGGHTQEMDKSRRIVFMLIVFLVGWPAKVIWDHLNRSGQIERGIWITCSGVYNERVLFSSWHVWFRLRQFDGLTDTVIQWKVLFLYSKCLVSLALSWYQQSSLD